MRKVQCLNRHYYDADRSGLCPHCGAAEAKEMPAGAAPVQNTGTDSRQEKPAFGQTAPGLEQNEGKKGKKKGRLFSWGHSREKTRETELPSEAAEPEGKAARTVNRQNRPGGAGIAERDMTGSLGTAATAAQDMEEVISRKGSAAPDGQQLTDWYETVVLSDEEPAQTEPMDQLKTVSIYADGSGTEPVTGWLVAVNGEYYGQSFPLRTGKNFIGRDISMDICLSREVSVSRVRHATIVFEPKHCVFLLSGGEGSGLTYCNDELVLGTVQLKAYNRLQLGEAEFVFLPFCGAQFRWDLMQ